MSTNNLCGVSTRPARALTIIALTALTACGGGGGDPRSPDASGNASTAATTSVPIVAAPGSTVGAPGTFTPVGDMSTPRARHTATLLGDGRVLITGGSTSSSYRDAPTNSTELYDPVTGRFGPTASMAQARLGHNATLLQSGKVLITGPGTTSTELYDPATGLFAAAGSMRVSQRLPQVAALLPGGNVLVADGYDAELYDPVTDRFSPAGPYALSGRWVEAAISLPDGRVLLLGADSAQTYDPASNSFFVTSTTLPYRELYTATLLDDGRVLIAGGTDEMDRFSSAGILDPITGNWTDIPRSI